MATKAKKVTKKKTTKKKKWISFFIIWFGQKTLSLKTVLMLLFLRICF